MKKILVGSGFHCFEEDFVSRRAFLEIWYKNTLPGSGNIVIVDNSFRPLSFPEARLIRCDGNLGHPGAPGAQAFAGPLLGWSLSWILPALVAYADGCDFVYKEQDCLAFGDWLPAIRIGKASIGRNYQMPCEQSLFYLAHDYILEFIRDYIAIDGHDAVLTSEDKFRQLLERSGGAIQFHSLPGGRDRPLPIMGATFYGQRFTGLELEMLRAEGLIV